MSEQTVSYTVHTHHEDDGSLWAEVADLPGCFASGFDEEELRSALTEAIGIYLSGEGREVTVRAADGHEVESVERRQYALC